MQSTNRTLQELAMPGVYSEAVDKTIQILINFYVTQP